MTPAEYAAAVANFGTAKFTLNTDGELYVDDGSGPVQLDNKVFDVVAQLGWAASAGSCGAKLGDLIDTLVAVAVFDDQQSKVSFELGNPPAMELNIIKLTSLEINPCPTLPPAAPAVLNTTTSAAATLTLSGINAATFDINAVQTAIAKLFGAADTLVVEGEEFPISGAAFSFATDSPLDGALAANVRIALTRAFASWSSPMMPSALVLRPGGAGGRRHLASARALYGLDITGVRSAYTANLATTGLTGMTRPAIGSRGLVAKLAGLGVMGAASPALDTAPTVSAVLSVTVTYASPSASPAGALHSALSSAAVAAVLSTAGVTTTGVSASFEHNHDDGKARRDAIIGGVIGGFFGLVLLTAAVVFVARRSSKATAPATTFDEDGKPARKSDPAVISALEAPSAERTRAPQLVAEAAEETEQAQA